MSKNTKVILVTAIGLLAAWALTPAVMHWRFPANIDKQGQAGDMFGAVNALFSGAALVGAIYVILLQHEELTQQRDARRGQFRAALSAVTEDLRRAIEAWRLSVTHIVNLGSLEAFKLQGHLRQLEPTLAAELMNVYLCIERINQITEAHGRFVEAIVASGITTQQWSNAEPAEEREALILKLQQEMPLLLQKLIPLSLEPVA